MKKGKYVFSLILNILIIATIAFASLNMTLNFLPFEGVSKEFFANLKSLDYLFEFGVIAGLFAAVVALITVISHIVSAAVDKPTSKFVGVLKTLSAGLSLFAVINYFVLDGFVYGIESLGFSSTNQLSFINILLDYHAPLFFSIVAPALVIFDYLFFELEPKIKFRNSFFALIPAALYFGFIALFDYLFVANGKASFPDVFVFKPFLFSTFVWYKTLLIIGIGVLGILLLTMLLLGVRNAVRNATVAETIDSVIEEDESDSPEEELKIETKEEIEDEKDEAQEVSNESIKEEPASSISTPVENVTTAPVVAPKSNVKKVVILKTKKDFARQGDESRQDGNVDGASYHSVPRVYHVSKQQNGKWQVKLAAGERAIKLFETQDEAIAYAKSLVRTKGGSIRIHGVSGKLRKE